MARVTAGVRKLLRPRLAVFATLVRSGNIRAAVSEGSEHSARHWRIDGPAAVDVGKELLRLQRLSLAGNAAGASRPEHARATLIATNASTRIAPYLGELTPAELQAWLGTTASAELTGEEPGHVAEYHRDGADWPSLNAPGSGPTWPTLQDRERP
jgi:hypothetical protein